jgi:alkylated DNA repair dioxygenase AlkB
VDNGIIRTQKIVEKETGETFNSCLLNLYHNGDEGVAWQSDKETNLKKTAQSVR